VSPGVGVPCELTVEVLPHEALTVRGYKQTVKCKIVDGDLHVRLFAKNPYVRKDGSYKVVSDDISLLSKQYGVWNGEGYFHLEKGLTFPA
jgi:hypothetical protein